MSDEINQSDLHPLNIEIYSKVVELTELLLNRSFLHAMNVSDIYLQESKIYLYCWGSSTNMFIESKGEDSIINIYCYFDINSVQIIFAEEDSAYEPQQFKLTLNLTHQNLTYSLFHVNNSLEILDENRIISYINRAMSVAKASIKMEQIQSVENKFFTNNMSNLN